MGGIEHSTEAYEAWLQEHVYLIAEDMALKHWTMAWKPVLFLRASYYRWAEVWPSVCPSELATFPVLAVADLHVENFGFWRDGEGRSVWGVNDFDECDYLPYTNDLIRLATIAALARRAKCISLKDSAICEAILSGYRRGISKGGGAMVVDEGGRWLRSLLPKNMRRPARFWRKIKKGVSPCPQETAVRTAAEQSLPTGTEEVVTIHRTAGVGSLGRPRVVAWGSWFGGPVAREAKQLAPPATAWARQTTPQISYSNILDCAVRAGDPFTRVTGAVIVRRLAPQSGKVDLKPFSDVEDHERLLYCMGWETANVHLGTRDAADAISKDLSDRSSDWLCVAVEAMLAHTLEDWYAWRTWWRRHEEGRERASTAAE